MLQGNDYHERLQYPMSLYPLLFGYICSENPPGMFLSFHIPSKPFLNPAPRLSSAL